MIRSIVCVALLGALSACGNGGASSPEPTALGGAGSGGTPSSGGRGSGGAAGLPAASGGLPAVPQGQLVCGGKQCHAGGRCAADGKCPAFLGDCFSTKDHLDTCEADCSAHGFVCAAQSCNMDGSPAPAAFSSVSFRAAHAAACSASGVPDNETEDPCGSIIWLSPAKPQDDLVRCCCRD